MKAAAGSVAQHRTAPSPQAQAALPDSRGLNLFEADPGFAPLLGIYLEPPLHRHLLPHFARLGALAGGELDEAAATADRNPPQLHQRTRAGEDRQWLEKHPAYRRLEEVAFAEYGLAAMSHRAGVLGWPEPLPPLAKYALTYVYVQAEFGVCCPLSMTDALTRTLRQFADPALVARYLPGLVSQDLDALTQGAMFMTEQEAGSDVGAIATRAMRDGGDWRLYGEKWFCSNADAGLALVLARPEGAAGGTRGLSLFLLPRTLPDGTPNRYRIVRLKDKLGTRSMASGEIRLEGALAYLVGDPGRGFVQMADMINMSRLSNGMRAAGIMRRALTEALFVARRRRAFGRMLIELPLMRRQLLKLMLPAEAARSMLLYTAAELARADAGDDEARRRVRLLTPLLKFRACRDARRAAGDAMEVRGGCGYIEEWPDARLVRDAHLGSIWEGTSNIVALDAMRAIRREASLDVLVPALDEGPAWLRGSLARAAAFARGADESHARQAASALYYTAAAAILWREGERLAAQGDARRMLLAGLLHEHRLRARDPMQAELADFAEALLPETPVARRTAESLLGALAS
jgi:acyl-CoA dehydrogenase